MTPRLEVNISGNLAYWGSDHAVLTPTEAEFLYAVNEAAPNTAPYPDICRAIWGKALPLRWQRELATFASTTRRKIAPWELAILCQPRIGYRLVRDPLMAGGRYWRRDEELLLCKLVAEGMKPREIARHLPRHSPRGIKDKLVRLRRAMGEKAA